jgi:hypothetical protein
MEVSISICRGVLTLSGVRFAFEKVLLRESLRLLVGVDTLKGITASVPAVVQDVMVP